MNTQILSANSNGFPLGIQADRSSTECLGKGALLELPDADLALECRAGILWVTRDGDPADYILEPGQRLDLQRGDKAAVQAMRPSQLRISFPSSRAG